MSKASVGYNEYMAALLSKTIKAEHTVTTIHEALLHAMRAKKGKSVCIPLYTRWREWSDYRFKLNKKLALCMRAQ